MTQRRPRTAYELLERVCAHILEEPRRYFQGYWGYTREKIPPWVASTPPPCGTVACRAGWVVGVHDGLASLNRRLRRDEYSVATRANHILGFGRRESAPETRRLFDAFAVSRERYDIGTRAYAEAGVRGLRAFMKRHKAHLQARRLKDV